MKYQYQVGMKAGVINAATMVLALLLFACERQRDAPVSAAVLQLKQCERHQIEGLTAVESAQCGVLSVAENPAQTGGRQISLNIVRLPALSNDPKPDPLFIFAGGPGQAATEIIASIAPLIGVINKKRDIVLVDQRGTGKSNPLDCLSEKPDYSLTPVESKIQMHKQLRECLAHYDADLRFYTTPFAINDIEQVRKKLGYATVNLWGASYGTRAALEYMRRYPGSVRTAVLDSVAPIGIHLPQYALLDADNALKALFQSCESQQKCRERFGDLEQKTRQIISQLNASPNLIEIEHPLTQEKIEVHLSGELIASVLRSGLYNRELGPNIPLMIESAQKGDYRAYMVMLTLSESMSQSVSVGMQQTILCAEDVLGASPSLADSTLTTTSSKQSQTSLTTDGILQLNMIDPAKEVCQYWPKGELPEDYFEPIVSDLPVLLLSGHFDPVTPPKWGEFAAESLSNSKHIIVAGTHHGSSFSGCMPSIIAKFINKASHELLELDCVNDIQAFPIFVSAAGPSMTETLGAKKID